MKNLHFAVRFFFAAFAIVATLATVTLTTGCKTDPCKDISCQNNGKCDGGTCACPTGYEGDFCQDRDTKKFVGNYDGAFSCAAIFTASGVGIIEENSGISIQFTGGTGGTVLPKLAATVNGTAVTIPQQTVSISILSIGISGSGIYNKTDNTLAITYSLTAVGISACSNVKVTYKKK